MMLAKNNAKFLFINNILGTYLIHNAGISQNNLKHLNNLRKLLFHHVYKIQKFEPNKKVLWRYLQKKINILILINNLKKKPFDIISIINLISFLMINPIFSIKFFTKKYIL